MVKTFITNSPAINMSIVGFGNAGSRVADVFATYKLKNGAPTYNCLALNSNTGDLDALRNIPKDNRVSLELGGLGKNPTRAAEILDENEEVKEKLHNFITKKVRPKDDLVLFLAGLGGGTGTSTIVKAIDHFAKHHNTPVIKEEVNKLLVKVGKEEFAKNQAKYMREGLKNAERRFKKIGIVVTLPLRNDGPDVLRQVNDFSQQLWKMANDPLKGIAFITFADNQHFNDKFKGLEESELNGIKNFRDYANIEIASIIHELNTAPTSGSAAVLLDREDFKRTLLEHRGSLVLSRVDKANKDITNSDNIVEMFKQSLSQSNLHSPIKLVNENIAKKVHHIGVLAVLDKEKKLSDGSFLEDTIEMLHEQLPINGTVFSGFIEEKNNFSTSSYLFYKVEGLPERLEKGLVEEFQEYQKRNKDFSYEKASIASIDQDDDYDVELDFSEMGLQIGIEVDEKKESDSPSNQDNEVEELDFDIEEFYNKVNNS